MNSVYSTDSLANLHVLIPCAGSGTRMGIERPKQYELLCGRPMVLHSIETFLHDPQVSTVWVGVSADTAAIQGFDWPQHPKLRVVMTGGSRRQDTVLNTLLTMTQSNCGLEDWVMVHDAARPGITRQAIERLYCGVIQSNACGGILALPVADTLKIEQSNQLIEKTVSREGLWMAQTPQMFRLGLLTEALKVASDTADVVTDEASAVEQLGHKPLLVVGEWVNLKVTYPADWHLMETLLMDKES